MATTSPDNLRTPDPGDPYNLISDLATLAGDVQNALIDRGNVFKGTSSERATFTSTAVEGMLWQDTDGMEMIWKKAVADWTPAVWRWSGTVTQMNSFGASAPEGFEWFNTTTGRSHIRLSGVWVGNSPISGSAILSSPSSGANVSTNVSFPAGYFATPPSVQVSLQGGMASSVTINYGPSDITATGFVLNLSRSSTTNTGLVWQAVRT